MGNRYQVTITTRNLNDKDFLKIVLPLLIWMIIFFVILGLVCIMDIYVLVIPMILEFLCIIPITICVVKNSKKLRQESFETKGIELTARSGRLYLNDKPLHISYDEQAREAYLHDMEETNHYRVTFFAVISNAEVEGIFVFCREHNIPIETEQWS